MRYLERLSTYLNFISDASPESFLVLCSSVCPRMDPFSITVGVAGLVALLALLAQTLSIAKDYLSSIKRKKAMAITLATELEALQFNLSSLNAFLGSDSVRAQALAFERTSVLQICTSARKDKLESLCKKLGQVAESRTSRYLWPLSEKEHQKTLQELRAFSQWMQFALSVDGCSLLSRTSDDALKIMRQQLEWFKSVQALEEQTTQLQQAVQIRHDYCKTILTEKQDMTFSIGYQSSTMIGSIILYGHLEFRTRLAGY
jgi:hypothetical protein